MKAIASQVWVQMKKYMILGQMMYMAFHQHLELVKPVNQTVKDNRKMLSFFIYSWFTLYIDLHNKKIYNEFKSSKDKATREG